MTKTRKYKNGEVYRGEFKGQKKHGFGELVFPDGRNFVGFVNLKNHYFYS